MFLKSFSFIVRLPILNLHQQFDMLKGKPFENFGRKATGLSQLEADKTVGLIGLRYNEPAFLIKVNQSSLSFG